MSSRVASRARASQMWANPSPKLSRIHIEEVVDQNGQIGRPLTQRRKIDGYSIDAEEEIQPEVSILGLMPKILLGCANKPSIDSSRFLGSHASKCPILENLQQLCLNRRIQAADFIEKHGSHMRQFHTAALGGIRPGEGAFFIPEQVRLDQRGGDCGTGHLDPGTL